VIASRTPRAGGPPIVASVVALVAAVALAFLIHADDSLSRFALSAAVVSLVSSICAALTDRRSGSTADAGPGPGGATRAFRAAAAATGLGAVFVLLALLASRGRYVVPQLWAGPPLTPTEAPTAFAGVLVAWGLLISSCGLQLLVTRSRRLVVPLFWLGLLGVVWLSLRVPIYLQTSAGVYVRSAWALALAAGLAAVLCGFVIARGVRRGSQRSRWMRTDPDRLLEPDPRWPGFRSSCTAVGLLLILLVCYHLLFGIDAEPVGQRLGALAMAVIAGAGAVALLVLLGRGWSVNLADVGMGLMSLAVCCVTLVVLSGRPADLSHRYPLILNALLVGLALMAWFWNWLRCVWLQQLHEGVAWTTAGKMIGPATRMAFIAGTAGLLVASLMAVWPRLSAIPAMDHSLGRMVCGVAGHLLLLWAVLWGARRVGQARFIGLAVLTAVSLLAFVYVRAVPLSAAAS